MFSIGWPELLVVAVIALFVIGPKDMPRAMISIGRGMRVLRMQYRRMKSSLDEVLLEAEMDEVRREAEKLKSIGEVDAAAPDAVKGKVGPGDEMTPLTGPDSGKGRGDTAQ